MNAKEALAQGKLGYYRQRDGRLAQVGVYSVPYVFGCDNDYNPRAWCLDGSVYEDHENIYALTEYLGETLPVEKKLKEIKTGLYCGAPGDIFEALIDDTANKKILDKDGNHVTFSRWVEE